MSESDTLSGKLHIIEYRGIKFSRSIRELIQEGQIQDFVQLRAVQEKLSTDNTFRDSLGRAIRRSTNGALSLRRSRSEKFFSVREAALPRGAPVYASIGRIADLEVLLRKFSLKELYLAKDTIDKCIAEYDQRNK